ncbi:MAG: NADH-quinone oxidoreductase subunit NuoB [Thermoproteota archaeon]
MKENKNKGRQPKKNNNSNNHGSENDGISIFNAISSRHHHDAPNILDNRIETIRAPLTDLKHISQKYRGKVAFVKKPTGEGDDAVEILQDACPTKAFENEKKHSVAFGIDHGKCIMCGRCKDVSPDFIKMENLFALPAGKRSQLVEFAEDGGNNNEVKEKKKDEDDGGGSGSNSRNSLATGRGTGSGGSSSDYSHLRHFEEMGKELQTKIRSIFGRSLAIRTVNAASCNGCEIEVNALLNPIYDVERFGIHFVSSPRHADVLLVTGPVSSSMEEPLRLAYDAIPSPKAVIAVGACGCSGGIFADSYSVIGGVDKIIPVDVYVPGCPPRPQALLEGILLIIDKLAASLKVSYGS